MSEDLYTQALSLFNQCKYEEALKRIEQSPLSTLREKKLLEQCQKQILEQYCYLINESIRQKDYRSAKSIKDEYQAKFGKNYKIEAIKIPEIASPLQTEECSDSIERTPNTYLKIALGIILFILTCTIIIVVWNRNIQKLFKSGRPLKAVRENVPLFLVAPFKPLLSFSYPVPALHSSHEDNYSVPLFPPASLGACRSVGIAAVGKLFTHNGAIAAEDQPPEFAGLPQSRTDSLHQAGRQDPLPLLGCRADVGEGLSQRISVDKGQKSHNVGVHSLSPFHR